MKTAISYLVPLQSYMYASCKTLLKIYFAIVHVDWKIKHSYSYSYTGMVGPTTAIYTGMVGPTTAIYSILE